MKLNILDFARNQNGLIVFQADELEKLKAVINNPCQVSWEKAHNIILDGIALTLWQAVVKIKPTLLEYKLEYDDWEQIPSREVVEKAIAYAVLNKGENFQN